MVIPPDNIIPQDPLPEIRAYFESIPWTAKLFSDPKLLPVEHHSFSEGPARGSGHTLFRQTLKTPVTIPFWQSFYKAPTEGQDEAFWSVLALGTGLNGHPGLIHGGFTSLIMDETLGVAGFMGRPKGMGTMTAYLHVNYKKPIATPCVVLAKSWVTKIEGKKVFIKGTIEDSQGAVISEGEALFILVDSRKLQGKL